MTAGLAVDGSGRGERDPFDVVGAGIASNNRKGCIGILIRCLAAGFSDRTVRTALAARWKTKSQPLIAAVSAGTSRLVSAN